MQKKVDPNELTWNEGAVGGFFGKELLNLETGTLKLVKVDPLVSYPLHRHPDKTEYAYVLEGNPEFEIDSDTYFCQKGDFVIFPVGKRHAIRNTTKVKCLLLVGAVLA